MPYEPWINEKRIDATAGVIHIEPSEPNEPLGSSEPNEPLTSPKQEKIRYLSFGRYKVGIIEDKNHRVLGISSIEVVKDFYEIDQLEVDKFYWDPEDDYD
jgi:hypothetical protein